VPFLKANYLEVLVVVELFSEVLIRNNSLQKLLQHSCCGQHSFSGTNHEDKQKPKKDRDERKEVVKRRGNKKKVKGELKRSHGTLSWDDILMLLANSQGSDGLIMKRL